MRIEEFMRAVETDTPKFLHKGSRRVEVKSVIYVQTSVGKGTREDPHRYVEEYWSMDGKLLAFKDPAQFELET